MYDHITKLGLKIHDMEESLMTAENVDKSTRCDQCFVIKGVCANQEGWLVPMLNVARHGVKVALRVA